VHWGKVGTGFPKKRTTDTDLRQGDFAIRTHALSISAWRMLPRGWTNAAAVLTQKPQQIRL
jgi:hypothetical protein